eukprot:Em0007g321a
MSTQSYHISKQVLISAAKAFMDECKSTGIVPDQTVKSISNGTFNVRKEIGLKKKRAEMKRLRRKMLEEKRDKEISDAKEKLRNLESDITTKMSKVNLNSGEGVYGAFALYSKCFNMYYHSAHCNEYYYYMCYEYQM